MEATPRPMPESPQRRSRDTVVGGMVLVIVGTFLLAMQVVPDIGPYVVIAIGLGLLALFAVSRSYGALVAGSVVSGVGAGIVLTTLYSGMGGAAMVLAIGSGFLLIWLLSYALQLKERHFWPLIPAAILGSIGVALLVEAVDLLTYWPVLLIGFGVLLMLLAFLRRETATLDA